MPSPPPHPSPHRFATTVALLAALVLGACSGGPERNPPGDSTPVVVEDDTPRVQEPETDQVVEPVVEAPEPGPVGLVEFAPHVRLNRAERGGYVEFDAFVPLDLSDPGSDIVFLEVIACISDTKEHEALLVSLARPSHVHAALLVLGLEPGEPGGFDFVDRRLVPIDPKGPNVRISLRYADENKKPVEAGIADWIVSARSGDRFGAADDAWRFSGSAFVTRQGEERYSADYDGLLIGLATFGTETIAYETTFSPDSQLAQPEWIADRDAVPPFGTEVVVRLSPVGGG